MNTYLTNLTLRAVLEEDAGKSPKLRLLNAINNAAAQAMRAAIKDIKAKDGWTKEELEYEAIVAESMAFEVKELLPLERCIDYILVSYRAGMDLSLYTEADESGRKVRPFGWVADLHYVKTPPEILRDNAEYGAKRRLDEQSANIALRPGITDNKRLTILAATARRQSEIVSASLLDDLALIDSATNMGMLKLETDVMLDMLEEAIVELKINWQDELIKRAEALAARNQKDLEAGKIIRTDVDMALLIADDSEEAAAAKAKDAFIESDLEDLPLPRSTWAKVNGAWKRSSSTA